MRGEEGTLAWPIRKPEEQLLPSFSGQATTTTLLANFVCGSSSFKLCSWEKVRPQMKSAAAVVPKPPLVKKSHLLQRPLLLLLLLQRETKLLRDDSNGEEY
jgi:hypothetical protein